MWVAGGDANYNGTAQYSWVNQNWTTISAIPWWATNYTSPALAWAGGNLFLLGGAVFSIPTNTLWVQRYGRAAGVLIPLAFVCPFHAVINACWRACVPVCDGVFLRVCMRG